MNILKKILKHTVLISRHRWIVFKLSIKAGIPLRGFLHDLSKFSPVEFFESVKYYNGKQSPIPICKEKKGYSMAWLHHKAVNKHHLEYWEDCINGKRTGCFPPYKYLAELLCDKISAGMTYTGKNWNKSQPLNYWINVEKKKEISVHPAAVEFVETVFAKLDKENLNSALNKKYLKSLYNELSNKYNVNSK